jgi:transposase
LSKWFHDKEAMLVVIEVGTQSPWISRLLRDLGHRVVVANARKLALIARSRAKDDRADAELLARLGRADLGLISEVHHRSEARQVALAMVRARAQLVEARTQLVNHCRGSVKSLGYRLPMCDVRSFPAKAMAALPESLAPALTPILEQIAEMTRRVRRYDYELAKLAEEQFPETSLLLQIRGVGPLTALVYVLTLESPERFSRSRQVGSYLGLVPARAQSGQRNPQLRITKQGDRYLRTLLVQCAHYILGPFGEPCNLRSFGERLVARGGKHAKRRAGVAVARKLAVLMHALWLRGEVYDPFFGRKAA